MSGHPEVARSSFYSASDWDEQTWLKIIQIEYDSLIAGFDFNGLASLHENKPIRLLDLGCGTGIFPRLLESHLVPQVHFETDILDISSQSLKQWREKLAQFEHFSVVNEIESPIEALASPNDILPVTYDLIWALHSLTTVDLSQMKSVFQRLRNQLNPGGQLLIYQLGARSTYQKLHGHYLESIASEALPYMTAEQSMQLLTEIGWTFEQRPFNFAHRVPLDQSAQLEQYLQKVVLDQNIQAQALFADLLPDFLEGGNYRFPQEVFLLSARK